MPLITPPSAPPPIPDDKFHLRVKVDSSQCAGQPIPQEIAGFASDGLTLSLADVVTHGAMFYKERRTARRPGETPSQARVRKVLQVLEDWQPSVRTLKRKGSEPRLIVKPPHSGEDSREISQLLGEAMTLYVASKAFAIKASRWSIRSYQKGVRHDIDAMGPNGRVLAEARGRFNGNNLGLAVSGIGDKFNAALQSPGSRSFANALGVVYCLRTSADDASVPFSHDVVLVDPPGEGRWDECEEWRDILWHYASFFSYQGKYVAADALVKAAELPDDQLRAAVDARVPLLPLPDQTRPFGDIYGRTTLAVGKERYAGTVWKRAPLLLPGGVSDRQGVFFFGLSLKVIELLASLRLREITEATIPTWRGLFGNLLYTHNGDGALGVWGTKDEILEHE